MILYQLKTEKSQSYIENVIIFRNGMRYMSMFDGTYYEMLSKSKQINHMDTFLVCFSGSSIL